MANPCCSGSTNGTSGDITVATCCSVNADNFPTTGTMGVRWLLHSASGADAGLEVPAFQVDASIGGSPLTINVSTRLWVSFISVVTAEACEIWVYRGDDVSDFGLANSTLLRGTVDANGGLVYNLDWIPLLPAEKLWVRTATSTSALDVIGYGRLENV